MNLDDIKMAEAVLLDANIFVYAALEKSQQCRRLLHRCVEHEVVGVAGLQQIAELMHRLMMVEAQDHDWLIGGNPAKHLTSHPERVRALNRYSDIIKGFLASGFKYETLAKEDFITAMSLQRQYGLMANDALMIAMAERLRIHAIASADSFCESARLRPLFA